MRGAIWLVLLLLAPLSSGMLSPLNLTPDFITPEESEFVLTRDLNEGVWSSDDWNAGEEGIQPLRVFS